MSITFSGLASGLDTDKIVKELMAIERAPQDRVIAKKDAATKRLEAFSQFKTRLDALKTAVGDMNVTSEVRTTKASLSSDDAISATSSSGAVGSYNVSVAQLSQVQKTITDGFSSSTTAVLGTGTITVNGKVINVTADNNSLSKVMQSINEQSETTGVQASIINTGSAVNPYHLVFTGKDSDTSFAITSNLLDGGGAPINLNPTDVQTAKEAVVFVDGIEVVSKTNTLSDTISGVTINLNAVSSTTSSGTPEVGVDPWDWADPPVYTQTKLDVQADTGALKEKVTTFVSAYNDVMEWILSGYEEFSGSSTESESSDEEEEMLGVLLRGDSTINGIKRQLQNTLTETIDNSGAFKILSEIGITTNLDGTLTQDNTTLDEALQDNFEDMVALLSGDDEEDGVMKSFNSLLLDITSSSTGMYALQKDAYDIAAKRYDTEISMMETRLEKRELALRGQFTAMENLVSSLNAQGDFLTQQLNALNGNN